MENYYEVLNCERNASYEELKRAYQKLALKYHPDKVGHEHHNVCNRFILINKAWKILSDSELRRTFDERWAERCLVQDWPIQEEVDIKDFEQSETASGSDKPVLILYPCRCGGFYELTESDIELKFDMVCCNTCSLCVKVSYN
ncbi:hypothetical protein CHS0354_003717 [Potamilus streckersoni]|uniref:Uncharacterized protein n=1 Tax=Potamilus streckersoni TaxID=2493646 RepID=A0AAE0W1P9_9BIVA|nr:hypothetical protein CHS0354_003717 [Potamilus streckersoni]